MTASFSAGDMRDSSRGASARRSSPRARAAGSSGAWGGGGGGGIAPLARANASLAPESAGGGSKSGSEMAHVAGALAGRARRARVASALPFRAGATRRRRRVFRRGRERRALFRPDRIRPRASALGVRPRLPRPRRGLRLTRGEGVRRNRGAAAGRAPPPVRRRLAAGPGEPSRAFARRVGFRETGTSTFGDSSRDAPHRFSPIGDRWSTRRTSSAGSTGTGAARGDGGFLRVGALVRSRRARAGTLGSGHEVLHLREAPDGAFHGQGHDFRLGVGVRVRVRVHAEGRHGAARRVRGSRDVLGGTSPVGVKPSKTSGGASRRAPGRRGVDPPTAWTRSTPSRARGEGSARVCATERTEVVSARTKGARKAFETSWFSSSFHFKRRCFFLFLRAPRFTRPSPRGAPAHPRTSPARAARRTWARSPPPSRAHSCSRRTRATRRTLLGCATP